MTAVVRWIRRWYGAHPLHLLALLSSFALAGYAVHAVVAAGQWRGFAIWFLVAIAGHDLLLFPLYSVADLTFRRLLPRWMAGPGQRAGGAKPGPAAMAPVPWPPAVNYVRVPAAFSLLLLLLWFPLIVGLSSAAYQRASGLATGPYLWRWLGVTGALFAVSSVGYALRLRRAMSGPGPARSAGARHGTGR
jgi:hypothetical protein